MRICMSRAIVGVVSFGMKRRADAELSAAPPRTRQQCPSKAILHSVEVVPFSVLGQRLLLSGTLDKEAAQDPVQAACAFLDPAGLHHIQVDI